MPDLLPVCRNLRLSSFLVTPPTLRVQYGRTVIIEIKNAKEGMVLREPVMDSLGRVLLPAGEALSSRHIAKLARWGIPSVDIEPTTQTDEPSGNKIAPDAEDVDDHKMKAVRAKLDTLFRNVEDDVFLRDLRPLAEKHLKRNTELWSMLRIDKSP